VSVNVSGRQLAHPGFVRQVTDSLYEARLDPRGLRLEVAESAMMDDPEATRRVLSRLFDEHSVSARIDDFGLGASSLRQIHRFPGDAVKLDRSFVVPMLEDDAAFDIVKAIIALAHNLGMEVIAEGVETQEHLDRLKLLGCEYAQGFYIAGPLDAGAATALLDRGTADTIG
jgi:EAL domain-containing protein (putative c-di-GMP-specific phosphodiesterase class I)